MFGQFISDLLTVLSIPAIMLACYLVGKQEQYQAVDEKLNDALQFVEDYGRESNVVDMKNRRVR